MFQIHLSMQKPVMECQLSYYPLIATNAMQCLLNILMLGVRNVFMKFVFIMLNFFKKPIRYQEEKKEENSENGEDKIEYEKITRSSLLYLNQVEEDPPTSKQNRKSSRRNHFILCKTHYSKANIGTSECNDCKDCNDFPVSY